MKSEPFAACPTSFFIPLTRSRFRMPSWCHPARINNQLEMNYDSHHGHHAKDNAHSAWLSPEPRLCLCLWSLLLGFRKWEEQGCHQHSPPGAFYTKKISQCNRTTPNIPVNLQEEVFKPHFDTLGGFGWLKLSTAVGIHMAKVVLNLEMVVFLSQALKPHSLSEENLQARWILLELLSGMCRQWYLFKYRFRISCLLKSLYKEMQSVSLLLALRFPVRCTSTGSAFEY